MPRSAHARTVARTASTPRRWPAMRGRRRRCRPAAVAVHDDGDVPRHVAGLRNFLRGAGLAAAAHTAISSFSLSCSSLSISAMCRSVSFCISSCARRSSFSEISFFFSASFSCVDGVAPQVAHRDARVLGLVLHHLDQLLAPLLGEQRHRHAHGFAAGRRIEAEVGLADRLLDGAGHLLLERRHADGAPVDQHHLRHLVERRWACRSSRP